MNLSIVATLYQSAAHLGAFYRRVSSCAKKVASTDYEIILVNDGSPDDSLDLAVQIAKQDLHVTVVDLSRNFGHHKAMMTGLKYARGERIFLIDSDLEEEPEWLEDFVREMGRNTCDVVYGVQKARKGNWFERWSGHWFYRFFKLLTGFPLEENAVTARLMSRRYVDALLGHEEREVFVAGLWHITGFDQNPYTVTKHATSKTTYNFRRKMALLVNAVTSFSSAPLVSIFYIGITIFLIAAAYGAYLIIHWFSAEILPSGWTSLMISLWLLGGMIISFIGIIGIYLSKVFSESKRRPYTIVRHVYRQNNKRMLSSDDCMAPRRLAHSSTEK